MKRLRLAVICILVISAASLFVGCARIVPEEPSQMSLYATVYPVYALARMIGDNVPGLSINCIMQPQDECIRSYVISDWDLYILSKSADCLLTGGRGLELASQQQLQALAEQIPVAEALYGLDLYEDDFEDEDSHFSGPNPHLYMSIDGSIEMLHSLCSIMSVIDVHRAEIYAENEATIQLEMEELKAEISQLTAPCRGIPAAVLNEALIYPAAEYGMDTVAIVHRESTEELSGNALDLCLAQLRDSGAKVVLIEKQAPQSLIDVLSKEGYSVACLDIMSTCKASDEKPEYLDVLRNNARLAALSCTNITSGEHQ